MAFGMAYGLVLEVVVVNLIVNQIQDLNTLYTSTPEWSWWVAHAMFGAASAWWLRPCFDASPNPQDRRAALRRMAGLLPTGAGPTTPGPASRAY